MNRIGILITGAVLLVAAIIFVDTLTEGEPGETRTPTLVTTTEKNEGVRDALRRHPNERRARKDQPVVAPDSPIEASPESQAPPRVRVLRSNGTPAKDAEIFLVEHGTVIGLPVVIPVGQTNTEGLAKIVIADDDRERVDTVFARRNGFSIVPGSIFLTAPFANWDRNAPKDHVAEITLPPCGSVEVQVAGPTGTDLKGWIHLAFPGAEPSPFNHAKKSLQREKGSLVVPFVQIGPRLEARYAAARSEPFASVAEIIASEREHEPDAGYVHTLKVGAPRLMVSGRMVKAAGHPWRKGRVVVYEELTSPLAYERSLRAMFLLEPDGTFQFPLPSARTSRDEVARETRRELRIELAPIDRALAPTRLLVVPLSSTDPDSGIDLGDVVPEAPPIIA